MAFPAVRSQVVTDGSTATATPVINLPATVQQNDVLFVVFRVAVAGVIGWPAGWTELFDASADAADDQMAAAWKRATGNESGTTITLSCTSGKFAAVAYAIDDSADPLIRAPELSTVATGTSTTPDATTCTPTGGAKDYLWLTFTGREGEATLPPTYPTNYTVAQLTATSGTAGTVGTNVRVSAAVRTNNNAASEDAAQWTFSDSEDWTAYTIAFHPPPADPVPIPTNKTLAPARIVRPLMRAAAVVLAFVPLVAAPPEDVVGVSSAASGQLFRPWTGQYAPIAGPMVAGQPLSWAPHLDTQPPLRQSLIRSVSAAPFIQPAAEISIGWLSQIDIAASARSQNSPSVIAAPFVQPAAAVSLGWQPKLPEYAKPYLRLDSIVARPPSVTASQAQNVTWWPEITDPLPRVSLIRSVVAQAIQITQAPAPADAIADSTGAAQQRSRGTVQYQAIAGPVSVPAAAAAPDTPLRFNDDGIIRPDRFTHHVAVAGPVAIPLDVGWWPTAPRIILARTLPSASILVKPPFPLNGAGRSDLPWLRQVFPAVRATVSLPSVLASPVTVPSAQAIEIPWIIQPRLVIRPFARVESVYSKPSDPEGRSDLPWLRLVLPTLRATVSPPSVLASPVTVPSAQTLEIPWIVQPRLIIRPFARLESVYSKPLSPSDPDGRSDLPWLPEFRPLFRALRTLPSQVVAPLREPDPAGVPVFAWHHPPRLVTRVFARLEAFYAKPTVPTDPDGRSDLPWLPDFDPIIRARWLIPSQVSAPLRDLDAAALPWLSQIQPGQPARRVMLAAYAVPVRFQDSELPWLRLPDRVLVTLEANPSIVAMPERDPSVTPWWYPRPRDLVRQRYRTDSVLVVPSITTASAQQGITWWPKFPDRLVLRIRQEPSVRTEPPTLFTVLAPTWVILVPEWPQTILVADAPQIILVPEWPDDVEIP